MGLDMYLRGEKFVWGCEQGRAKEDGFEVARRELELGYWRKHPNLHGFIVDTFADGVDECQEISLGKDELKLIIDTIRAGKLREKTRTGFFFGTSYFPGEKTEEGKSYDDELDENAVKVFENALAWLTAEDEECSRTVHYRASW